MHAIDATASSDTKLLRLCLLVIAAAYAAFGMSLVVIGVSSPLSVAGRTFIVALLCLQVFRGHNWARLLLGAFTVPIAVVAVLSAGILSVLSVRGLALLGLPLVFGGAYVTLVAHPLARAQLDVVRTRRSGAPAL